MPLLLSLARPLSRARTEANRPNRNRLSFRAVWMAICPFSQLFSLPF
jgi:hypothetical protein